MLDKDFTPITDQLGIPGTSYQLQLGLTQDMWVSTLIKGSKIIDYHIFKDIEEEFPNQELILKWILKVVAIPNINQQQIKKITQKLVNQALEKQENTRKKSSKKIKKKEFKDGKESSISNKIRILNLLKLEPLTSKQIGEKLKLDEQDTRTYLLRLKNENKIRVVDKIGRFYLYDYKTPQHQAEETMIKEVRRSVLIKDTLINTLQNSLKQKERKIRELNAQLKEKNNIISQKNKIFQELSPRELTDEYSKKLIGREKPKDHLVFQYTEKPPFEEEKEELIVFQYNDELTEYQKLQFERDVKITDLLDPEFILLFVDSKRHRVWIWHGSNTTTRMKFIAAKLAPSIRDRYGIGYKISAVDEANETSVFNIMAGVEKEVDFSDIQKGPAYEGTEEDLELLDSLSREKILLLLEKSGVPEGYERKMVIVKNKIYGYREYDSHYLDSVIKEKRLFPLTEIVEDGTYLAEKYIPRMLFSYNNVVLTELLQEINT